MTLPPKLLTICASKIDAHLLKSATRVYFTKSNLSDYSSELGWWLLKFECIDPYYGQIFSVLRAINCNEVTTSKKIFSRRVS